MKRKIFSKLLMGALLIASVSSFVSCKDYDDDITAINDKIATLALQSTVENLQSQLQQAISAAAAAQSTADQAVKAAAAAQSTADAAATKAALAEVDAAAKAAGEEAAKAITNAATAQTAADAAQKTADEAAAAAKAAQAAADAAAAAAATGSDAAKAEAAAAKAAAEVAQAAAEAAAKAAADNKSAVEAAAAVAAEAKKAADEAAKTAAAAAGKEVDLSNYVTKAALEEALKNYAKATNDYVTNAKLNEELTAIKNQLVEVNNGLKKIEALGDLEAFKQKVDSYQNSIKELYTAITNVSLYLNHKKTNDGMYTYNNDNFDQILIYDRIDKNDSHFTTVKLNAAGTVGASQGDGTFGKKDFYGAGAAYSANASTSTTFQHAAWIDDYLNEIVVRVSPSNATLTADGIKFIDTAAGTLDGYVEVVGVEPYKDNRAQTRAGSATGLWSVYIRLKNGVTRNELLNRTYRAGKPKVYALKVNNTTDASDDRYAVSEFDITFSNTDQVWTNFRMEGGMLTTDWSNYTQISAVKGRTHVTAGGKGYADYQWVNGGTDFGGDNTTQAVTDRTALTAYAVNNGQTIIVISDARWSAKYMYVIRDDKNANLDNDASELNAWNTYTYTGLNTLVRGNWAAISVTIPKTQLLGDEVAFRAFAVGYDGCLIDPDGIPFTVFVGNEVRTSTVTGSFHATKATGLEKTFDVTTTIGTGQTFAATMVAPIALKIGNTTVNTPATITWKKADGTTNAGKWSDVKKVLIHFDDANDMNLWTDNATATARIAFQSGTPATDDWYVDFALTKQLPDANDVKDLWSWKSGQLNGNVWTAVMYPETGADQADAATATTWTAARTDAYKGINNAINGLVSNNGTMYITPAAKYQVSGLNFLFSFANSREYNKTYSATKWVGMTPAAPIVHGIYADGFILNVADATNEKLKVLIDDKTQHASTINFNFGQVASSTWVIDNVITGAGHYDDYVVILQDFQTVYACPFDELSFTISPYKDGVKKNTVGNKVAVGDQVWNYVYYNDASIGRDVYDNTDSNNTFGDVSATVAANANWLKVSSKLGAEMVVPTLADLCGHLKSISATFFSNDTKNQDYFTATVSAAGVITLTRISGTQDPRKDIPSTLRITGKCAYDHSHTFDIPFTVKTTAE